MRFQNIRGLYGLLCMRYLTVQHLVLAVQGMVGILIVSILFSHAVSDHSNSGNQDSEEVATCQRHQIEGDCDI